MFALAVLCGSWSILKYRNNKKPQLNSKAWALCDMVNCWCLQGGLLKKEIEFSETCDFSDMLIWTCWLSLHLVSLPVLLDGTLDGSCCLFAIIVSAFPHKLAKPASKRKVVLYDGKSLKLVYLLKLAVSSHSAQVVTDLRPVKAEPTAACLVC